MKEEVNLNPKRDYVNEAIINIIGGFIFWGLKGFKGDFANEINKKNNLRNTLTAIILWIIILIGIAYIYLF